MTDQVDLSLAIFGPQVDVEYEHGMINVAAYLCERPARLSKNLEGNELAINLLASGRVNQNNANAWRRCDGPAILVAKTTHARPLRLLNYIEPTMSLLADLCYTVGPAQPNMQADARRTCKAFRYRLVSRLARCYAAPERQPAPGAARRYSASREAASVRGGEEAPGPGIAALGVRLAAGVKARHEVGIEVGDGAAAAAAAAGIGEGAEAAAGGEAAEEEAREKGHSGNLPCQAVGRNSPC